MTPHDRIMELVNRTLDDLDSSSTSLSATIRKSIRIARLRSDYDNLWWLEYEMVSFYNEDAKRRIALEIIPHYTKERFEELQTRYLKAHFDERSLNNSGDVVEKGNIVLVGVEEIEAQVEHFEGIVRTTVTPQGLHPIDLYIKDQANASLRVTVANQAQGLRGILARIKHRVHDFLSETEKQLVFGQMNADIFERNRQYVDLRLSKLCPEALRMFGAVYRRMGEEDKEARSQALGSCRRILKEVSDELYPPSETPVIGRDGKERVLTEDKFVARLWQFVADRVKGTASGDLLLSTLVELGGRLDRVYDLSCKGVHSEIPEFELNQCVIQVYLLIGDLLRLYDRDSAMTEEGVIDAPHRT